MKKNRMLIALMEEYRRAAIEYKEILANLDTIDFITIVDKATKDPDCQSIQNLTFHVVQSGYTYANYVRSKTDKGWLEYEETIELPTAGIVEIDKMLDYTAAILEEIIYCSNEEIGNWKFETRWAVTYDFEQLMEHAIVHILRHRRQVENFVKKLKNNRSLTNHVEILINGSK